MANTDPFQLPALPYADNALEPVISSRTISFHYGKHHAAYVAKLNSLVKDSPLAQKSLEAVIKETAGQADKAAVFNNAAQVWNHTFYWNGLKSKGGGKPGKALLDKIEAAFSGFDNFKKQFADAALTQFGSGWVWLVAEKGALKIVKTANADTPIVHSQTPLLTIDVWEHAYYLDYQNKRNEYAEAVIEKLLNWNFAEANLLKG